MHKYFLQSLISVSPQCLCFWAIWGERCFFSNPCQRVGKEKELWRILEADFLTFFVLLCYPKCGLGNSFLFAECLIYPMF